MAIRGEPEAARRPPADAGASPAARGLAARLDAAALAPDDRRWSFIAAGLLAGLAAVMAATFLDYGVTWDEEYQRIYGEVVLRWYTSLFRDRGAVIDYAHLAGGVDHFYGAAFDLVAQLAARISPLAVIDTRHLVNAAVALAGVVATYRLGALLGGARSGVAAAVLLASTPAYHGHAFANPKDIPFAALHAWVLVLALASSASSPRVRWRSVGLLGVVAGLALGVRVGGAFVLGYVALAWGIAAAPRLREPGAIRSVALPLAARLAAVGAVAWGVLLLAWPAAQLDPVGLPLRALLDANRTGTVLPMLFDGNVISPASAPASYLPRWLLVTLPETWFVALAAAAAVAVLALRSGTEGADRTRRVRAGVLAFSVAFPVGYTILARPVVFDAWRHFLFVAPPLAALAGHGLSAFVAERRFPRAIRAGAAALAAAALLVTVADMVRLHPYEAVYFNRTVGGGLAGAAGRFELDYWGASHREGVDWVLANVVHDAGARPVRIASCYEPFFTEHSLARDPRGVSFESVRLEEQPDLVLAGTRFGCADRLRARGWRTVHVVERVGVPLLYVLDGAGPR